MNSARLSLHKNMFSPYRCKPEAILLKKLPKLSGNLGRRAKAPKQQRISPNGRSKAYQLRVLETENTQLKSELEKFRQENLELRAQLKAADKSARYEQEIQDLKSQIQKLIDENNKDNGKDKEKDKEKEKEEPQILPVAIKETSNTLSINKNLNRQLQVKPVAILETFFIKIGHFLKQNGISNEQLIDKLDTPSANIQNIKEAIESVGIRIAFNELEAVFNILQKDGTVNSNEFIESIAKYGDDFISDVSSDISSPRTKLSVSMDEINLSYEGLQESIDFFAVILRNSSKEEFESKLKSLPEPVKYGDIHKLFLEKPHRIEEGVERNKLTSFLMNACETQPKSIIISKFKQEFFWYEDLIEGKDVQEVYEVLKTHKTAILKECKTIDLKNSGYLSWKHFFPVVNKVRELKRIQTFELKCKCYSFENSLHSIPYEAVLNAK